MTETARTVHPYQRKIIDMLISGKRFILRAPRREPLGPTLLEIAWQAGYAAGLTTATPAPEEAVLNYEQMRLDRGWPTPIAMRRAADGLDRLSIPRYGDVLRWFADQCDAALLLRQQPSEAEHD